MSPRPLPAVLKDSQVTAFRSIIEGLLLPCQENDHIFDDQDIGAVVHQMHWQTPGDVSAVGGAYQGTIAELLSNLHFQLGALSRHVDH